MHFAVKFTVTLILISFSLRVSTAQDRPEFSALNNEQQELITRWLSLDCTLVESKRIQLELESIGAPLATVFIEAYNFGLSENDSLQLAQQYNEEFLERRDWLQQTRSDSLFSEEDYNRMTNLRNSRRYVSRNVWMHVEGIRLSALSGLFHTVSPGMANDNTVLGFLEPIINDENDPGRFTAQAIRDKILPP